MTDKLDLTSLDLVNENVKKIAELFPNCITETANGRAIDFDLLKQELNHEIIEGNKERYRLEWPGKREAIVTSNLPTTKTLRPVREDSVDFDNSQNLYIEGDNLEVLKLLQESYLGKIKVMCIDPPYNTGKDFVYKDNFTQDSTEHKEESGFVDELNRRLVVNPDSSGRYHSDWLTMMYPRLKLARNLLTNDGIIFISIDDNEVHNLRKVCDEIFGEINYQGLVSRVTGTPTGGGNKAIVNEVDFVLIYSKTGEALIEGAPLTQEEEKIYDREDSKGRYLMRSLRRTGGEDKREDRPSMYYPMIAPDGTEIYPIGPTGYESRWICGKDKYQELLRDGLIHWQSSDKDGVVKWQVLQKFYLEGRLKQPSNLWKNIEGNKKATRDVKKIFEDKKVFDFPKPIELITYMLRLASDTDSIVLDFFSGSATTAHSLMQLNLEDNGDRRFILVQIPEETSPDSEANKAGYKNICEIGKERIRRAGIELQEELKKKNKNKSGELNLDTDLNKERKLDTGFRVFRLSDSNMKDVYYRPQDFKQEQLDAFADNIKPDRTADDLLIQIMLDWGLPLSLTIEQLKIENKQVFKVAENSLLACFDKGINEAFAKAIAEQKPLRVVFKDSSFEDNSAKENVKQLLKQLSPETEMKVI